jgi:O-antigen ligase
MMENIFKFIQHRYWTIAACVLALGGLVYSSLTPIPLSIGTIILVVQGIVHPALRTNLGRIFREPDFRAVCSIFLLYFITGLWSADQSFFWHTMRMKLPFLLLPLAFLSVRIFDRTLFRQLMYLLFWLVALGAIGAFVVFLSSPDEVIQRYGQGQVMLTPANHIRFSLMVVLVVCLGLEFFSESYHFRWRAERWWVLGATVFMIVFLHVLAVRSGLLALYCAGLYFGARYIVRRRRYVLGIGMVAGLAIVAWLSFQYVPTLKKKLGYTLWSIDLFERKETLRDLSDSRRLGSIVAGVAVSREHPWLGVGVGDIKTEVDSYLREHYPDLVNLGLMPHNQYLFVLVAAGWLGLLWFVGATLWPLLHKRGWHDTTLVAMHIIFFTSFLVEHTLETQVGTAFYLFPLLMAMRARRDS